jgi:hypothetical protein
VIPTHFPIRPGSEVSLRLKLHLCYLQRDAELSLPGLSPTGGGDVRIDFALQGLGTGRAPIVHSFSSVVYVELRGAKTTGPVANKFVFS